MCPIFLQIIVPKSQMISVFTFTEQGLFLGLLHKIHHVILDDKTNQKQGYYSNSSLLFEIFTKNIFT